MLAVNLTGTFNVTRLSIPFLKKSDAGVIIIMSSVGGRFGYQPQPLHHHQARPDRSHRNPRPRTRRRRHPRQRDCPRRRRGRPCPRCPARPGRQQRRRLYDVTAEALSIQAVKRFVDPHDIAALMLFLASDSAKSISGQTIAIDGDSKAAA